MEFQETYFTSILGLNNNNNRAGHSKWLSFYAHRMCYFCKINLATLLTLFRKFFLCRLNQRKHFNSLNTKLPFGYIILRTTQKR